MSFLVLAVCLPAWKLSGGPERELKVTEYVPGATWTQSFRAQEGMSIPAAEHCQTVPAQVTARCWAQNTPAGNTCISLLPEQGARLWQLWQVWMDQCSCLWQHFLVLLLRVQTLQGGQHLLGLHGVT